MKTIQRREFLAGALGAGALLSLAGPPPTARAVDASGMRFGLVTYLWGQHMDLPTLLDACERSGLLGVEVRTQHAHGVEPSLTKAERSDVKNRFADSPVELVGYGSNAQYHESDPAKVAANVALTKDYVRLMHDCGGTGVKVKPNSVPEGPDQQRTIERIATGLRDVGADASDYGQEIRVEVHGRGSSELPIVRAIMEATDHPNVKVCWNSNAEDLHGEGLEPNFNLVKQWFGATVHVRELNIGSYPYSILMWLFRQLEYKGWILLEARTNPADKIAAMIEQEHIFQRMIGNKE